MGHGDVTRKQGKTQRFHRRQIAHGAICNISGTMEGKGYVGVYFSEQGAGSTVFVDILQYQDSRLGHGSNVLPPVDILMMGAASDGQRSGAKPAGSGIAQHRRKIRELTMESPAGDGTFVARPYIETLNGVRNRTRIQLLEFPEDQTR